jgi:hypothetical protein
MVERPAPVSSLGMVDACYHGRVLIQENSHIAVRHQGRSKRRIFIVSEEFSFRLEDAIIIICAQTCQRLIQLTLSNCDATEPVQPVEQSTVTRTYKNNLKSLAAAWLGTDIFLNQ